METDLIQWLTSQGIGVVFAVVVFMMLRDMIIKMNENYCKITDALIKLAERSRNSDTEDDHSK